MAKSKLHNALPESHAAWMKLAKECHYCGKEMACRLNYSELQLRRTCRERFGVNLKYWLCWQRMAAAADTLRRIGSIPDTAWDLGFSHVSSFCRAFKAWHRLTPGEFLASVRRWESSSAAARGVASDAPPPQASQSTNGHDRFC